MLCIDALVEILYFVFKNDTKREVKVYLSERLARIRGYNPKTKVFRRAKKRGKPSKIGIFTIIFLLFYKNKPHLSVYKNSCKNINQK